LRGEIVDLRRGNLAAGFLLARFDAVDEGKDAEKRS